jgi:hypothetical protein
VFIENRKGGVLTCCCCVAVQAKVRGALEREQEEICKKQDREYRQLAKTAAK